MAFQIKKLGKLLELGGISLPEGGVVGIDIGSSSIKVIQLAKGKNGAALETYGELQLGPYANQDIGMPVVLEPGKLAAALVDIVREATVTARTSALSIPHAASFVVVAPFPTRDQSQLASMVPIEARKYVPMAMNEITLDWFIVPDIIAKQGAPEPTSTRVLMAAIHNESMKRYRTVVQNAGIAIVANEIEPFSVVRSSVHESDGLVALIDMGASSTKTYLVDGGILQETHRLPVGGRDLTSAVSAATGSTFGEGEIAKRTLGIVSGETRVTEALLPHLDRILADVTRTISRAETERERSVERVILAGGGALLSGLVEYATERLGRTVALADAFGKVEHPAFLEDTLREAGPSFAVALGIGLRRFAE